MNEENGSLLMQSKKNIASSGEKDDVEGEVLRELGIRSTMICRVKFTRSGKRK